MSCSVCKNLFFNNNHLYSSWFLYYINWQAVWPYKDLGRSVSYSCWSCGYGIRKFEILLVSFGRLALIQVLLLMHPNYPDHLWFYLRLEYWKQVYLPYMDLYDQFYWRRSFLFNANNLCFSLWRACWDCIFSSLLFRMYVKGNGWNPCHKLPLWLWLPSILLLRILLDCDFSLDPSIPFWREEVLLIKRKSWLT